MNKKVVFITGASKGLGKEITNQFLSVNKGFCVFATARNIPTDVSNSDSLHWYPLDVTKYEDCKKAIERCIETFGQLDILICNASAYTGGTTIADVTNDDIETEIDTTLKGSIFLAHLFVKYMRFRKTGKVFFFSSNSGLSGTSGSQYYSTYAASKAALIRFSECLNEDISNYNMQSHVLIPSNMRDSNFIEENAISYADVGKLILNMIEIGDNLSLSQVIINPAILSKI